MNPFDLRGPQFLVFYAGLILVTVIVVAVLRRRRELELAGSAMPQMHDPYAIACLRGGSNEVLRVAVVSLIDRGLLAIVDNKIVTTPVGRETHVRKRTEEDLLRFCTTPRKPQELAHSAAFQTAAEYETVLAQHKLLPDEDIKRFRRGLYSGGMIVLLFFAVTKFFVAMSRGRTNVGFLILMALGALVLLRVAAFPRRTVKGNQFLAELSNLVASLRLRAATIRPGGANADLALAAAVFGVEVLPYRHFGLTWKIVPPSSSGSSSGSSCGSGGCGGGCGGGGCGGCGG